MSFVQQFFLSLMASPLQSLWNLDFFCDILFETDFLCDIYEIYCKVYKIPKQCCKKHGIHMWPQNAQKWAIYFMERTTLTNGLMQTFISASFTGVWSVLKWSFTWKRHTRRKKFFFSLEAQPSFCFITFYIDVELNMINNKRKGETWKISRENWGRY